MLKVPRYRQYPANPGKPAIPGTEQALASCEGVYGAGTRQHPATPGNTRQHPATPGIAPHPGSTPRQQPGSTQQHTTKVISH